jgi:hypothetical protein
VPGSRSSSYRIERSSVEQVARTERLHRFVMAKGASDEESGQTDGDERCTHHPNDDQQAMLAQVVVILSMLEVW